MSSDHNINQPETDWITSANPQFAEAISYLKEASQRLRESVKNGHTHLHVGQAPLNAVAEAAIKAGHIDVNSNTFKKGAPTPDVPKEWYLAYAYQQGDPVRLIVQLAVTRTLAIVDLLDASVAAFETGNVLVAFICCRSVIENVALFDKAIDEIRSTSFPDQYESARDVKGALIDQLNKRAFAQKIDWKSIAEQPKESLRKNKLKYKPSVLRLDLSAEQILNLVDDLNKKIPGTRAVYEVLCEFAHPNVGVILAHTNSFQHRADSNSVEWIEKRMSFGPPAGLFLEMGELFGEVMTVVAACVKQFETVVSQDIEPQRKRLQGLCQVIVRHMMFTTIVPSGNKGIKLRDALDPYAACPCGSSDKIKFCCGQVKRG